ncbi:MAG TPA: DNA/RNA nuclease SfsA, partial [Candidatus Coprocola pullicola]|nr:DNA/RNA nuclease SfsA [Candidatus Coprocola pullicola]
EQKRGFIEVKGVTLEENAVGLFPDAPTQRGTKHIYELIQAKKEGYEANILFLIQMQGVDSMRPHWKRDVDFANALQQAQKQGVAILAYDCIVKEDSICLAKKVPFFIK